MSKQKISVIFLAVPLLFFVCFFLPSCNYYKNLKYKDKVFRIRIEIEDEGKVKIETWENATDLSYDNEENSYTFYIKGALVKLWPTKTVIIEEQSIHSLK